MNDGKIALSVEELIYCLYSAGYFEQGNGLKQVYLEGVTDEQMDLALQIVCRTLMAKGYLRYENRTFILRSDVADIVSRLNDSERTVRASKHRGEREQAVSFHVSGQEAYRHDQEHDGQVHVFRRVDIADIAREVSGLFQIRASIADPARTFELSQADFEELLGAIDAKDDEAWEAYCASCPIERQPFARDMKEAEGRMNTLLFLEFDDRREPSVQELAMFPNGAENGWIIVKSGDAFVVADVDEEALRRKITRELIGEEAGIGI
ncbi:hypothetical protein MO973_10350 [Paenibacillus sp. TRM 82003]|nr:hypothetical protein [Paenibacillus sp. TRM 82003]